MKLARSTAQLSEQGIVAHVLSVALRDEDDVVGWRKQVPVAPKDLADHPLDAVALNGGSHFLRHGDPKSRVW